MEPLELHSAFLRLKTQEQILIINPQIKSSKGLITITGCLNPNQFKDEQDILQKLELKSGTYTTTFEEPFAIIGLGSFGTEVEISPVDITNFSFQGLKVNLTCYGSCIHKITHPTDHLLLKKNELLSVGIEGLKMQYLETSTVEKKRTIFGKEKISPISYTRDFSTNHLNFQYQQNNHSLSISLIEDDKKKLTNFIIEGPETLDLEVYNKIKYQLRAFLSFASGNNVVFRQENYRKDNNTYLKTNSVKRAKRKNHSEFIPIGNIHFRDKNILSDYFKSFDTFLIVDRHFDLSDVIFLFNQARKGTLDTAFFVMLIIVEKLADKFTQSPFYNSSNDFFINENSFNERIKPVKSEFEKHFSDIRKNNKHTYDILNGKLNDINKKTKTDKKINKLLEFVEIKKTEEIERLFPVIRNIAIHEGRTDFPEGTIYENYKSLELIINNIIANLMQYKGIRFIRSEGKKNYGCRKTDYNINYENYR